MVNQALEDAHERLIIKKRNYDKAARYGNAFSNLALILFYLSFLIPIVVIPLNLLIDLQIPIIYIQVGLFGGMIFAFVLIAISVRLKKNIPSYLILSLSDIEFFKAFNALKELEVSLKNDDESELSRSEAAELISNIERDLNPSKSGSKRTNLRRALTNEIYDKLEVLRRNLNDRLIPTLRSGEIEDVKKTYSVIEELAKYLLKPSLSKLDNINSLISELPSSHIEEEKSSILFSKIYPQRQHIFVFSIIFLISYISFYVGINYFDVPRKDAYTTAILFLGTLLAGYFAIIAAFIVIKRGQ